MSSPGSSRRRFLRTALGGSVLGSLAGCLGPGTPEDGTQPTATIADESWKGDSRQFQFDARHSGNGSAPGPSGEIRKHFALPRKQGSVSRVRPPAVVGGIAYVTMGGETDEGTSFTELVAVDVAKGSVVWRKRIEGSSVGTVPTQPVVHGGRVFFGSEETMFAYDAVSGDQQWAKPHSFGSATRPTVTGNRLLVEDNSVLYAIDTESGEQLWEYKPRTVGSVQPAVFVRSPAAADDTVYVCGSHLEAVDAAEGTELWNARPESRVMAAPTVGDQVVYVGTRSGWVHAFSRNGGKRFWKKQVTDHLDGVVETLALGDSNVVLMAGPYSGVKAISAEDGSEAWSTEMRTAGPPIVSNGTVYVRNASKLVALGESDGKQRWAFSRPTPSGPHEPPVVSGKYAFYVRGKSQLLCLRGDG